MALNYALQVTVLQFFIIIAIAVSGMATFVNTYDAIAGINKMTPTIEKSPELQKAEKTRFYVFLCISLILFFIGAIMAYIMNKNQNQRKIISYGLMTAGLLGFVFTLTDRFRGYSIGAKLAVSWIALIVFIVIALFITKSLPIDTTGSAFMSGMLDTAFSAMNT